jgi:hypothetical protein
VNESRAEPWGQACTMVHTSTIVAGPAASCRRCRFVFRDSHRRDVQAKRREAIAYYLAGWAGAEIVAEHRVPGTLTTWVTFTTSRWVPVAVAAAFVQECPHVARGTLTAVVGWQPKW